MAEQTIQGQPSCPSSGAFMAMKILTGTGTYVPTPGTISIDVVCVGSGAGAGGILGVIAMKGVSPGGGAGSFCRKYITPVAASYTYEVGIGGPGGEGASAGEGEDGSNTFFGAVLTAPGGIHSVAGTADSGTSAVTILGGSAGSMATGGDFNSAGIAGGMAINLATLATSSDYVSGAGGDRPGFGTGGAAQRGGSADGLSGQGYGAGGGGAMTNGVTSRNGGAGADGVIIITEYS